MAATYEHGHILERITVGVGGSARSLHALRYALWLARTAESQVQVIIVNEIVPALEMAMVDAQMLEKLRQHAGVVSREHIARIERKVHVVSTRMGVPVTVRTIEGHVVPSLVEAEAETSLFVVGKRGHRDEHGGLLGSNAELIVRRTHRSLLLTPREFREPCRILVGYAGHGIGSQGLLSAAALSAALRLPCTVLNVNSNPQAQKEVTAEARKTLRALDVDATFEECSGKPAERLIDASSPDTLLVLGATGRSRLYSFVLGSVTEEVMRSATGPILVTAKAQ